jgi:hypothetical protein
VNNWLKDIILVLFAWTAWTAAIDLAGGATKALTWRGAGVWALLILGAKLYESAAFARKYS